MSNLMKGRQFQLWEYHVSNGSALIRSPAGPGIEETIDVICVGVEYSCMPRYLGEVALSVAAELAKERIEGILRKKIAPSRIRVLESLYERFLIVAVSVTVAKHDGDILRAPSSVDASVTEDRLY